MVESSPLRGNRFLRPWTASSGSGSDPLVEQVVYKSYWIVISAQAPMPARFLAATRTT
jgi:hypothetical protein